VKRGCGRRENYFSIMAGRGPWVGEFNVQKGRGGIPDLNRKNAITKFEGARAERSRKGGAQHHSALRKDRKGGLFQGGTTSGAETTTKGGRKIYSSD